MTANLGETIEYNDTKHEDVFQYVGVIGPVVAQVKKDKEVMELVNKVFTLTPSDIEKLSVPEINRYLLMIPRGLIFLQDCVNRAVISEKRAEHEFEDVIALQAALLTRKDFGEGAPASITKEMRLAKMREKFPTEYNEAVKKMRERQSIVLRLEGQLKHLQVFNDNLKKVRDTYNNNA